MAIPYPMPPLSTLDMLQQIQTAREELLKITGVSSAILPNPDKVNMSAMEIMAKVNTERQQQLHPPRVVESVYITEPAEDWSQVRSPGRARRRRHKHRQNIRYYRKPAAVMLNGRLHIHPELMRRIRGHGWYGSIAAAMNFIEKFERAPLTKRSG